MRDMNETTSPDLDAAKVGKMYVTSVTFQYHEAGESYNNTTKKYDKLPGRWHIQAKLSDKLSRYGDSQQMSIVVEQGVGARLAEVLMPVIVAEASRKAQQLADDSKAMLQALGERTITCIANMPEAPKQ